MLDQILSQLVNLSIIEVFIIFTILSILNGIILLPSSQLILIIAGIISINNNIPQIPFLILLIISNTFGNYILYKLAYKHGEKYVKKIIPMNKKKLENQLLVLRYLFKKYGNYIILIGRNLPLFHSLVSIPAGITKIKSKTYLIYTSIGITIWSVIFFYLGRYTGENFENTLKSFETTGSIILITLAISIWFLFRKYYKKTLNAAKKEFNKK
jgi:membrane protein DedA with SNARE-associated domain